MGPPRAKKLSTNPNLPTEIQVLQVYLTQPMDPQKKSLNFIFPTKYVFPKSLKFSHWPSKLFEPQKKLLTFH